MLTVQGETSFVSLLRANFGDLIRFEVPRGGLAIWVEFEELEKLMQLEERAIARNFSLLWSELFRIAEFSKHGLRLGFASKNDVEMTVAIRELRNLVD